jgi:alpha-N-arabinofuranosidase
VLRAWVESPTYDCVYADPRGATTLDFPMSGVPYLKAAAVHSAADRTLTLFLLNRRLDEPMTVSVVASGFGGLALGRATTLRHDDLGGDQHKGRHAGRAGASRWCGDDRRRAAGDSSGRFLERCGLSVG